MGNYNKILVIKLGALGDWIHMTGWYSAIRQTYPNAHITFMTGSPFIKLAKESGYFDDFIVDDRSWNPIQYLKIMCLLNKYDLIIDLQNQTRTRKRYYTLGRIWANHEFQWAEPSEGGFKLRYTPSKKRFFWGKEEQSSISFMPNLPDLSFCKISPQIQTLLPQKYVLLIPGCSPTHPYKRWPATFYAELAQRLTKDNIYSVVLGTSAEQEAVDTICKDNPLTVNLCNKSSLLDIPAIAASALAIVGNDTGPQHMAELGTTPAVTLFCDITKGSTVSRKNVTNLIEKNIEDISVDIVYTTLQSLWHKA